MGSAKARIRWLRASEGGRSKAFSGDRYSTLARFDGHDDSEKDAWSLVARLTGPLDAKGCGVAEVSFLASNAPLEWLRTGARFALYEGRKKTAEGEVL